MPRFHTSATSPGSKVAADLVFERARPFDVVGHRLFGFPASIVHATLMTAVDPAAPATVGLDLDLEHLMDVERSTFRGFERACYGGVIQELTQRMYSSQGHVEGGIFNAGTSYSLIPRFVTGCFMFSFARFVADSAYPKNYPTNHKRESFALAILEVLRPASAFAANSGNKPRLVGPETKVFTEKQERYFSQK